MRRQTPASIQVPLGSGHMCQRAAELPCAAPSKGIAEALLHLDDTICEIRDVAFTATLGEPIPHPETMPGDATIRELDSKDDGNGVGYLAPRTYDSIQPRLGPIARTGRPLRLRSGGSTASAVS